MFKAKVSCAKDFYRTGLVVSMPHIVSQIDPDWPNYTVEFMVESSEKYTAEQELDYDVFLSPQRGDVYAQSASKRSVSLGGQFKYNDIQGKDHWFRDLRHYVVEGQADGTELLGDLYPTGDPSYRRVWIDPKHPKDASFEYSCSTRASTYGPYYYDYVTTVELKEVYQPTNQQTGYIFLCHQASRFMEDPWVITTSTQVVLINFDYEGYTSFRWGIVTPSQPHISWNKPDPYEYDWDELAMLEARNLVQTWWASNYAGPYHWNHVDATYLEWRAQQALDTVVSHCSGLIPTMEIAGAEFNAPFDHEGRPNHIPAWADLSARAMEEISGGFNGNGYAYMRDCKEFIPSIKDLMNSVLKLRKGGKLQSRFLKTAASVYLSIHYGFKLFAQDSLELYDSMNQNKDFSLFHRNAHERYSINDWAADRRYTIVFDERKLHDALEQFVRDYDLLFTGENLWDLIPYSFVVDWFTDIQSALTAMDNYAALQRWYNVVAGISTEHATKVVDLSTKGISGSAKCEYFGRDASRALVPPNPFAASNPRGFSKTHALEAGALVVSNS